MNNSVYRISLDIHDTASQVFISAKKGDTARSIHINLQESGKPYRIADGCHAVFTGVKPDGNYLFNDCIIRDNVIIYNFTEQTVPVVGQVNCEIALYDANNERITSPRFDIIVNDVVYNNEEIVSSNEANALISATAEAKAITAEVEQKLANGEFVGEKGEKGDKGDKGDRGEQGLQGEKGDRGEDADPQLFANAVKGYAEGEAVRADDVSPVEHIVNVKVDHADPTSAKVIRSGKNLIPYPYYQTTHAVNGITFTDNGDGTITANGTATENADFDLIEINDFTVPKNTILSSGTSGDSAATYEMFINGLDGTIVRSYINSVANNKFTANRIIIRIRPGTTVNNLVFKPQLEYGSTATEYVPYVESQTYTPNADGTVEGITSLSPTMSLLTDTEGVVIHCEYNRDTNKVLSTMKTAEGTVVSQNADFAEVAEWADGNPNNEDRTGYFVCADVPVHGIVMKKATSIDDVKGVSILAPAFAGNYTKDKLDSNGNLLPKYSYVAIIGFVPVRDNGTCTVGGRCMPDDNGCAIPSSNNMGYQVVNRIDENRVLIIIEPNGDMVQRVKTKILELQERLDNIGGGGSITPSNSEQVTHALQSLGTSKNVKEALDVIENYAIEQDQRIASLEQPAETVVTYADYYGLEVLSNTVMNASGATTTADKYSNYWATNFIFCGGMTSVEYNAPYISQYVSNIAFFGADKKFIQRAESAGTSLDVPENACYVRFCGTINNKDNFYVKLHADKTVLERLYNAETTFDIDSVPDGSITRAELSDSFMCFKTAIYAGSDANDLWETGDYLCYGGVLNTPTSARYGVSVRRYKESGSPDWTIYQRAVNLTSGKVFVRVGNARTQTFTEWADIVNDHTKLLNGKTILLFGDSITVLGNIIAKNIAETTGATVVNCGFSGCRMAKHLNDVYSHYSMGALASAISSNDFTEQENALSSAGGHQTAYTATLESLKSVDFSSVDFVSIAYGTNDWNANVPLRNDEDEFDVDTFEGALRYALKELYTKNPSLRINVCTPLYRFLWSNGAVTDDSDVKTNTLGLKLTDYIESIEKVCGEFHTQVIDLYNEIGFNKYTATVYYPSSDGVHPNQAGRALIGKKIATEIMHSNGIVKTD